AADRRARVQRRRLARQVLRLEVDLSAEERCVRNLSAREVQLIAHGASRGMQGLPVHFGHDLALGEVARYPDLDLPLAAAGRGEEAVLVQEGLGHRGRIL